MRLTKEVALPDGNRITCRELLLSEIREWLADMTVVEADVVGDELIDAISLTELRRLSDLSATAAEGLSPSELQMVADACKEVNPHFFRLRARLWDRARVLSDTLTQPPAPSPGSGTQGSGPTRIASS